MQSIDAKIASLLSDLPDPEGARLFWTRLTTEQPKASRHLLNDEGLLSDVLALAAWSPLLGTTLEQNPSYINWLGREKSLTRVKTQEEFFESLARFALTNTQLAPQALLARFRRRELLRIYLRDLRDTATIVETTEELSNLADAVLQYGLRLADQELSNFYGTPLMIDERGRTGTASFCVVALGKLGSFELNYASDIDLLFLYSDDGNTTGVGTRGPLTNREYFIKLAGAVARIVGQESGEGAPYRVDLRLRPHGRDGDLAVSLDEAIRYYRQTAHPWELQTLIRARSAAGSSPLYARFSEAVRDRVYRRDETVARALSHVRLAKRKIDRHHGSQAKGFNVKLGRGGIREIEFIAQALQLAYGGRDIWLQAPHTLISLGRLADRHMITESELTQLAEAYAFLRKLEHRLQMEHGLQTHLLPEEKNRRTLVARRMHFFGPDALPLFERELEKHLENVSRAFSRVFDGAEDAAIETNKTADETRIANSVETKVAEADKDHSTAANEKRAWESITNILAQHLKIAFATRPTLTAHLSQAVRDSLNPQRAMMGLERFAYSLAKLKTTCTLEEQKLVELIQLCGTSEYFMEMIASNPALIQALPNPETTITVNYDAVMREAIEREENFGAELSALRRVWSKLMIEIGALDAAGKLSLRESNARQSALAAASINAGYAIARRELLRRLTENGIEFNEHTLPALAVLGLGRLSGAGLDYGSDLDLILIYEEGDLTSGESLQAAELMARLAELFVAALSSVTREGQLYRIDLRLRPDGKNGPLASPSHAFLDYLQTRAAYWELLAYVKLRAVGGDGSFGQRIEKASRNVIHQAAASAPDEELRTETKRVRERLERERQARQRQTIDIKYGAGGMLDVYFATRYLQLKDGVADEGEDRSTLHTLDRLHRAGALGFTEHKDLSEGYQLLRKVDHYIRLIVGRSTRLQSSDHPALRDIALRSGFGSAEELLERLKEHMGLIRRAYEKVME